MTWQHQPEDIDLGDGSLRAIVCTFALIGIIAMLFWAALYGGPEPSPIVSSGIATPVP